MAIELKVPSAGESITEVEIGSWLKKVGEQVEKEEPLVSIETDKTTIELSAPEAGSISEIKASQGDIVQVGDVIGLFQPGDFKKGPSTSKQEDDQNKTSENEDIASPEGESSSRAKKDPDADQNPKDGSDIPIMPAARKLIEKNQIAPSEVKPTGKGGRILKEDVIRFMDNQSEQAQPEPDTDDADSGTQRTKDASNRSESDPVKSVEGREEEVVRMSPLRRTVARRLVEAQQKAALLTTFNEVDMSMVMSLRKQYQDSFTKKYNVKLGFMSFFVKASVDALKQFPAINSEVREDSIVYRNYFDIGIAIGGGRGLVVPILRNTESMSFAEIEIAIGELAHRARENKLKPEELQGGTFTITNGGVYGSMLSTPIVNPPQSGILGLHAINERPMAVNGEVVIRPVMYIALTYDHRIVDGREAVSFLVRIKEAIENPARMLLEI